MTLRERIKTVLQQNLAVAASTDFEALTEKVMEEVKDHLGLEEEYAE